MDTIENIGQAVNISALTYTELKAHREEVDARLREMAQEAVTALEHQAELFGLSLVKAQPVKQKRKRRTKDQIAADNEAS